ncbi:hypothetical protein NBRC10512v2_003489 [Rhodotorula toruloides]|uniref:RHTO0S16e00892g1_1 n=2 Tax=Rhodotorula toruloides TaxID=5286 RepID=A0A061BM32_RHOTO|nr:ring finger protein 216 [Rhodotorula toruloides NP11]EMS20875.1 ring finger protein 216 [Rhodotorula toruloides NP11]CDR48083.1 RHTO0S16e00892g1_1 [Rhodotorula toruloides]
MTPSVSSHVPSSTTAHSAALTLLTHLFPHTSPPFLASCVTHHLARQPTLKAEEVVERVGEKLLVEEREEGGWEMEGEEVRGWIWIATTSLDRRGGEGIAGREEVRRAFGKEKRRGREDGGRKDNGRKRTRKRRVDETLARNLALIRLHALFPLEPISSLRSLVLKEKESFLSRAVEEVLRFQVLRNRRARERREREGRQGGMFWRDVWETLFPPTPSRVDTKGKGPARDDESETPPVLTPGDLVHPSSYNAALSSHFHSLFPLLSSTQPGRIEEVVEREGGTYEGMRGRLEEEELRAQERRGRGRRGWWGRLIGLQDCETAEEGEKGKRRAREERGDVHPLLRGEVEAFWRAREGRSETAPATTMTPTIASGDPAANVDDECQCCFAPISPDPAHSVSCSPSPSSQSPSSPADTHSFCYSCLAALIRTYTFEGASLPDSLLQDGSIPCFAASSLPCSRSISPSSLSRVLDPALRAALDRRILETTLDRLASSGAPLARCPFCPYAVMRDSTASAGPLASVFVPAWVGTFPPSAWEAARTVVGVVCLSGLVLVGCVVVLLFGGSSKLERTYEELYPSSPSSPSPSDDPDSRATPLLSLQTNLLLAPHHTPFLLLTHIRTLVSRILSVKLGRNTVFVCGASGGAVVGRETREGGWLRRLEGVQELQWEEEEEVEGEEGVVEEMRRARLVEYLWPAEADERGEGEGWEPCGRLSCTLCSAPLNPSAPALHRCTSASSSSSWTPASEQAQAEESLRLAVEKAMSDAVSWVCARCGARGRKEVGAGACNKVTCRCGTAYCHLCHAPIPPSVGYTHFCQHPHDPRTGTCERGCGKCGLWTEPDERARVESARRNAQRKWALDHPDWAEKVNLSSASLKRVGPDLDVDSLAEQAWDVYDAVVATVARMLLS